MDPKSKLAAKNYQNFILLSDWEWAINKLTNRIRVRYQHAFGRMSLAGQSKVEPEVDHPP